MGRSLMDSIDQTYFAFRRRLRDVASASTCECNACIRIPSLNLKILAHHGPIGRQRIAGRDELVGSEVILAHRLLKNEVEERTGMVAYALYTDACIRAMGVEPAVARPDRAPRDLRTHRRRHDLAARPRGRVDRPNSTARASSSSRPDALADVRVRSSRPRRPSSGST